MATGKIVFGGNEILVSSVYAYAYSNSKVVLRVFMPEEYGDESRLHLLKDNTAPIEYYERKLIQGEKTGEVVEIDEWELKATYDNYDSGEYVSGYKDGVYSCEVTRVGETEKAIRRNTADIAYLGIMSGVAL